MIKHFNTKTRLVYAGTTAIVMVYFSAFFLSLLLLELSTGCVDGSLAYHDCHIGGIETAVTITMLMWGVILGFPVVASAILISICVFGFQKINKIRANENT